MPDQALGFRVQNYGIRSWSEMFTPRQQLVLATFADAVRSVRATIISDGHPQWYADAIVSILGLCVGKLAQANSTQCRWRVRSGPSKAELAFGMATVPMVWDFAETNPFGGSVGDWQQIVQTALRAFDWVDLEAQPAEVTQTDARSAVRALSHVAVFTDPPYFKQIGYATLSDYFYPWLRRALRDVHPDLFGTLLTPKEDELIAEPARHNGNDEEATRYFVDGFRAVFSELRAAHRPDVPLVVVYAYRQQESTSAGRVSTGWDALLQALIESGCMVTGTWPVHCAGATRERSQDSNAISSYVALVCRARPVGAGITDRREVIAELRATLPTQIREIQTASIAPVDLAQAAIGPGMAVFSRYAKVLEADGSSMTVRSALALINQALDEILAEQEGDFDGDTRFAVTWFEQRGFEEGPYGEADVLARAKDTSTRGLEEAGILQSRAGKVRLLRREELDAGWDPAADRRPTVWEAAQHLARRLETGGEDAAAELLRRLGGLGETARELAYRLYTTSERKGWAQEALAYNALVVAWPEIARRVAGTPEAQAQQTLEV
jgi:putative DNA methylase